MRDSEPTAKKAKAAMKRPSRAAAVASSKAWKDNIKSYNNLKFGDSGDEDDYEDEGPSAAARSKKAKAKGGATKRKRPVKDNSDDDFSDNFSEPGFEEAFGIAFGYFCQRFWWDFRETFFLFIFIGIFTPAHDNRKGILNSQLNIIVDQ